MKCILAMWSISFQVLSRVIPTHCRPVAEFEERFAMHWVVPIPAIPMLVMPFSFNWTRTAMATSLVMKSRQSMRTTRPHRPPFSIDSMQTRMVSWIVKSSVSCLRSLGGNGAKNSEIENPGSNRKPIRPNRVCSTPSIFKLALSLNG